MRTELQEDLDGVTTDGDVRLLYTRAKALKQRPAEFIANYYGITYSSAEYLIDKAFSK